MDSYFKFSEMQRGAKIKIAFGRSNDLEFGTNQYFYKDVKHINFEHPDTQSEFMSLM